MVVWLTIDSLDKAEDGISGYPCNREGGIPRRGMWREMPVLDGSIVQLKLALRGTPS